VFIAFDVKLAETILTVSQFEGGLAALKLNIANVTICASASEIFVKNTHANTTKYREFARCDGLGVLIDMMRLHPTALSVCKHAVLTMRNCICFCPEYSNRIASVEDFGVISRAFEEAMPHADYARCMAHLIDMISRGGMETQRRLGSDVICRQLVVALKKHGQSHALLVCDICGAITNLANVPDNKAQFTQAGALSVLHNVLRALPSTADAAVTCQQAIASLN
jgi:hypothetical protein